MPRHFIALRKYSTPWLCIEGDPPEGDLGGTGGGGGGGDDVDALKAEIARLKKGNSDYEDLVSKLRPFERRYKKVEAILGETNPERLQQLREYETKLSEVEGSAEQKILAARKQAADEYQKQLLEKDSQIAEYQRQKEEKDTEYDMFRAFNDNGGIGNRFKSFMSLTKPNISRGEDGNLQFKDDAGNLVIYRDKDPLKGERVATPADFIKMLHSGKLAENYQFSQMAMLQLTLEEYNKGSGAGLPFRNGVQVPADLQKLSQSELGKLAFNSSN